MRRLAPIALALTLGLLATPASAVVVAECGGTAVVTGASCHVDFLARDGGYFIFLHPGRIFTGTLRATVTNPVAGFSVTGTFVLGELVAGSDALLHDLTAGVWKLTVSAAAGSVGRFSGSVQAGPF